MAMSWGMKTIVALLIFLTYPLMAAEKELKAFPEAGEGMSRYVLVLPQQEDETKLRVEILVGKAVKVDPVNRFFFAGSLEKVKIEGWGYTRYVLEDLGPMGGTRMGVPPGQPDVERFVTVGGEPFIVRYNSKLPVVVYVPEGAEVRYRIWEAPAEFKAVPEG